MNKDTAKYLLEGIAETFKDLSEVNGKDFTDTDDAYFSGKEHAYSIASSMVQTLVKTYFTEDNTAE